MDIFGHEYPVYHFENRARENPEITLGDLSYKNFYIFTRYEKFKDPVVRAYMKYFATRNADSSETQNINSQVAFYKTDTFIRNKYMTYEYDLHESKEAGRAEGKVEGIAEAKREMIDAMLANGKLSDEEIANICGVSKEDILKRKMALAR